MSVTEDPRDKQLSATSPRTWATGVPAVTHAIQYSLGQTSVRRTALTLLDISQAKGFDRPGCAWPEPAPGHRHRNEYCANGAKHTNDEATSPRVTAEFFRNNSVAELDGKSDHWLNQQGRLTEPLVKHPGAEHYEPIGWDEALSLLADEPRALDSPDEALFHTSVGSGTRRPSSSSPPPGPSARTTCPTVPTCVTSPAAQRSTRRWASARAASAFRTSTTPIWSSSRGRTRGTNHPRMLSALEETKRRGGRIVAVNPLPEAGLLRFKHPQKARGVLGRGTVFADQFLQIRPGGDLALFQVLNLLLLQAEDEQRCAVLDHAFISEHTIGFDDFAAHARKVGWPDVLAATGLTREEIEEVRDRVLDSGKIIVCWAMGLAQHEHGVPSIRETVNFLPLHGNIGRPGAGVCPVRGHSNVQGDRAMGI